MIAVERRKIGVVLLHFGGPDSLDAVEPFLYELFSDPDIFELPFGPRFQRWMARLISHRRAPTVIRKYEEIGGKSPIVACTEAQQMALQSMLREAHPDTEFSVYIAGRYWRPFTEDAIRQLQAEAIRDVVLLPLYPQYSRVNAGSCFNEWDRVCKRMNAQFNVARISEYYTNHNYLGALNARISGALENFSTRENTFILFSAHGTPVDIVERGDPYAKQIRLTMEAVMELRGHDLPYALSYQSKVGPKQWLTPSTTETIQQLGLAGVKAILVVPIAFVSDHIETLHELNIDERRNAGEYGIEKFEVTAGLNTHPLFIQCLAELVESVIKERFGMERETSLVSS